MRLKHVVIRSIPSFAKKINVQSVDIKPLLMAGPSDRTMRTQRQYNRYRASTTFAGCVFCKPEELVTTHEYANFVFAQTKFQYEIWDDHLVDEHFLLIPKRHVEQIRDFTDIEQDEYLSLLSRYESDGYSFYSRAPTDSSRSVTHFHTHLLRLSKQAIQSMVYIQKPHVLLYKK